jgi:dTDP-glucose 4,6-dehydratase
MKILVTGGAGFIGSNFLEVLINDMQSEIGQLCVLDALTYSGDVRNIEDTISSAGIEFVHGSICDRDLVDKLSKNADVIINFAAESHVDRSIESRDEFVSTNIVGTQILLDAAIRNSVSRYVQISTDEVYGSLVEGSATETSLLLPNSPYSASKASADLLVRSYVETFGLDAVITRCTNNYGPKQHPEKLIPKIITNLLSGKQIPIYGNGKNIRDWIHVSDHCRGIVAVLKHGQKGEIYNISGDNEITNLDIVTQILEIMGFPFEKIDFVPDRPGHDFRYSLDGRKIMEELNFVCQVNFTEGLAATIDWYKRQLS